MKYLILLFVVLLSSCNEAKFNTGKSDQPENNGSSKVMAGLYNNPLLDGQQAQLKIKLTETATVEQVFNWEILDSGNNSATDYFVLASGTASIPSGQDNVTVYLTSIPASVATGTEFFNVNLSGPNFASYRMGILEVRATAENPTVIDTVSIVSVENNGYANIANQSSYDISGVCSYVSGNISVTVGSVNGNATCAADNTWSLALNLSSLSTQGSLTVQAIHSGVNIPGSADRQIIRDTIAPTVAITSPAVNSVVSFATQNSFTVSGTCTENSALVNVTLSSTGGGSLASAIGCASGTWSLTQNVSSIGDGTVTANISHNDLGGNSDLDSRTFIKNTIAPSLAISSPVVTDVAISSNYTSQSVIGTCNKAGATVTLTGDVSGTLSTTCDGANFSFTGLTVTGSDGFKSIFATMTDAYGNSAFANTILLKHVALPTATLTGTPAAVSNQEILNVTVGGVLVSEYRYKLGDNTLDCSIAAGYSTSQPITTPITDNLGADGNKKLCVVAVDSYGNNQAYATATIHSWFKDTSVPILNITSPVANSYVNSLNETAFSVTGDCGIDGSNNVVIKGNINTTTYTNCTSGTYSANVNFTNADQGPVFIIVEQTNPSNGNTAQASRIFYKDTILPDITFSSPAVNAYINKSNRTAFTVSGTCDEYSATPNIVVTGGTASVDAVCSGTSWTADLSFADETNATPTITVEISDVAGNTKQVTRDFILDTVNPTVAITTPTAGSFINNGNKASYSLSGTCSDVGLNNVVVKHGTTTLGTVNCTTGTPNWTASVDVSAISDGALTLSVEHTEASTNKNTASVNLTKDIVAPAISWESPLANVCVSAATSGSFEISGTCTDGDGAVQITSTTPAINETATCSSGHFSKTLNINTGGLTNEQSFSVNLVQTDDAGNSASGSRSFKFINLTPSLTFGGWEDVYAIGEKTYLDGNPTEDGVVRIKWKEWPASNTCLPNAVRVYRTETPTGSQAGALVSSDIPTENRNFEDETLTSADFTGKAFYYGLKANIAGDWVNVDSSVSPVSELRVVAPPNNMALVHRWITNQEVCGIMGRATDEANHYRCAFTGQGNVGGFHDMEQDLLVDRFQLGCSPTFNCGAGGNEACVATNQLNRDNPNGSGGVQAPVGAVYYQNLATGSYGQCWYKYGANNNEWRTLNDGSTTTAQLAIATTSEAHAAPLAYISQSRGNLACSQQTLDLSLVTSYPGNSANSDTTPKRLLRQKEWRGAAAWDPTLTSSQINTLENGGASGRCNTANNRNGGMTTAAREFYLGFDTHGMAMETGSKIGTKDCQSRYGIQDMVGNLWEWGSDQLSCPTVDGYTCVGQTSTVDAGNSDMNGFLFDGQNIAGHGPGDRRALADGTFTANDWVLDTAARNGTTYFNPVLGLPLMADDGGGSVSIAALSALGFFQGDRFYLSPTNGNAVRGVLLGGFWYYGSFLGRWASHWNSSATLAYHNIGARCALPVK